MVTTFTRDLELGVLATRLMTGVDPLDPARRSWPADVRLGLRAAPVVAVPRDEDLAPLSPGWRCRVRRAVDRGPGDRCADPHGRPLRHARRRAAALRRCDRRRALRGRRPVPRERARRGPDGRRDHRGRPGHHRRRLRHRPRAAGESPGSPPCQLLEGCDLLLLPTTTEHPTIAAVQADPVAINRRLGTYTNFVNLLDLAAVAVPAGRGGRRTVRRHGAGARVRRPARGRPGRAAARHRRRARGRRRDRGAGRRCAPARAAAERAARVARRQVRAVGPHVGRVPAGRPRHAPAQARSAAGRPRRGCADRGRGLADVTRRRSAGSWPTSPRR